MQIGPGVKAIQVQPHKDHEDSNCFYLKRVDGTVEDFSASKCINSLFPAFGELRGVMVRVPIAAQVTALDALLAAILLW